ncbi:protein FAM241B [Hemicordylus capensis]|uniref:protein FAM241B n=1 Tax=Hemicordylus capensis TaxID=884348 RepID=UPI002302C0CB|nr:protein FAM241B [Hemicordylus capensis]XP_053167901.1 protein FAM241B [Hemicordylus capensis]XP_053167902.1 protein FAM241B [Hemicordylus capensis]XP_053167903.1 protein FAM241B [Hemicordylus capensis]XP_053167904.1 protein FAM241B [Hemicordylus capensis]
MVRILANGDIVQDDDPRVRQNNRNRENSSRPGFFNTMTNAGPAPQPHYQHQQHQHNQGARPGERSPFSDINQQLVNMGFPTWNLGNQVVEPVMSILLLFLLMMVGVRGLLLVGLIYIVSHLSQR